MKKLTVLTIIILNFLPLQSSDECFSNAQAFLKDKQLQEYTTCLKNIKMADNRYLYLFCHKYGHTDSPETDLAFEKLQEARKKASAIYYRMSNSKRQELSNLTWHFRVKEIVDIYDPLKKSLDAARISVLIHHGTSKKQTNKKNGSFR